MSVRREKILNENTTYSHLPSATVPLNIQTLQPSAVESTGMGAFNIPLKGGIKSIITTAGNEKEKDALTEQLYKNYYMARTIAREYLVRAVFLFLLGTGLLAFLGFLKADTQEKQFLSALSVVINAIAAMHYWPIVKIRSVADDELTKMANEHKLPMQMPFRKWVPEANVVRELTVDSLRYSDWLVRSSKQYSNTAIGLDAPCSFAFTQPPTLTPTRN